jgi:hypothetical protein
MKRLIHIKWLSSTNHLIKALFVTIAFSLLNMLDLYAQSPKVYNIAVYEYNCRGEVDAQHRHYKYEIRNLFKKVDTGWVINNSNKSEIYRRVYKGALYETIIGYESSDSMSDLETWIDKTMLTPIHPISLKHGYFSKQFEGDDAQFIKKGSLLSNNSSLKQNTKFAYYKPSDNEEKWLLDTTKAYMSKLFKLNRACIEHSVVEYGPNYLDTIIKYVVENKNEIFIDTLNSFVDKSGNKIINILFPARSAWNGGYPFGQYYPFDGECFREDDGIKYYRILCYMQNDGQLIFLCDELKYLDHGDFDNDGKDEFLFWTSRHNRDGYVMYYDNFKKSVSYIWNYH